MKKSIKNLGDKELKNVKAIKGGEGDDIGLEKLTIVHESSQATSSVPTSAGSVLMGAAIAGAGS